MVFLVWCNINGDFERRWIPVKVFTDKDKAVAEVHRCSDEAGRIAMKYRYVLQDSLDIDRQIQAAHIGLTGFRQLQEGPNWGVSEVPLE